MRPERLREIEELFEEVLAQAAPARAAWLEAHCPHDPLLRAEVDALLSSHDGAEKYFDTLVGHVSADPVSEMESVLQYGSRVGPYRILRVIGHGGMGTVFLAERGDGQFEQRVALKLVRLGMESDAVIRRFLAERQIVAGLTHPNIARLLDGGVTSDGRPFFVMEYVEGSTITEYCDAKRLTIDERLTLFLSVAQAVEYAHQRLIVHRDVKPSNILVSPDGTVKLLDFGIAKLLDDDHRLERGLTETGDRPLTTAYAAPELLRSDPVTTAADVYSLGVVLYELLTGQLPHGPATMPRRDLERKVLEDEITKPSDMLSSTEVAELRGARLDRVQRRLRGDVDTICLMALRREPDRRYQSVEQLIEDIRRHRSGLWVTARADSLTYRTARFVRRHRLGVSVAAVLTLLTVGVAVAMTVQSVRLARERDKAQQVASLFVDLFEVADPSEARGAAIPAREVLDRGVEKIEGRLAGQPEVQVALFEVLGRVYQNLGLYERSASLLEKVVQLRREQLGSPDAEVASALGAYGESLRHRGNYDRAEQILREALALAERANGRQHQAVARSLNDLGKVLYAKGGLQEAEPMLREALDLNRATRGPDHVDVAETLNNLAAVVAARNDFAGAESMFREALLIRRAQLGNDHPSVPAVLSNLASVLARKGDYAAAEDANREALAIYQRVLGADHPTVATTLNNLGLVLFSRNDLVESERILRDALAVRRKRLPAAHPDVAQTLANLGLVVQTRGRTDEANTLYQEALEIRRAAYGNEHPLVAQTLNNLGLLRQATGRFAEAETLYRDALGILRARLGPSHPVVATSLHNLGSVRLARGDATEAETMYRDAMRVRRATLPAGHPDLAVSLVALGRLLDEGGRPSEAEPLLREAVDIRHKALPPGSPALAEATSALDACRARLARLRLRLQSHGEVAPPR